jgi:hypothetical protein
MKYTLTWKPRALQQLADIWLAASDKNAVSIAVNRIERHLQARTHASSAHLFGSKLIIARPLVVLYDVSHDDCLMTIVRVGYRP